MLSSHSLPPATTTPASMADLAAIHKLRSTGFRMLDDGDSGSSTASGGGSSNGSRRRRRQHQQQRRPAFIKGRNPNIHWRALSTDDFRAHPRVIGLPPVDGIQLAGPQTFWWVRQDDPLWDELHDGVLTSRHLLAALGMREPRAARASGLPRAVVQPGAIGRVWRELHSAPAPGRLEWRPADEVARADETNTVYREAFVQCVRNLGAPPWPPARDGRASGYDEKTLRRTAAHFGRGGVASVRCAWGSAQEASAIVAALESALPRDAVIEEIGMAVLHPDRMPTDELRAAAWAGQLPTVGASPDAMLRRTPGGPLEAVEVKNTCPFFELRDDRGARGGAGGAREEASPPRFAAFASYIPHAVRETLPSWMVRGPHESLPVQYVPQVQVEMLVTGATRATYISASAAQGINLITCRRDDAYLADLLFFLRLFWCSPAAPQDDFYWSGAHASRYTRFLKRTEELGVTAKVGTHVKRPWRRDATGAGKRLFLDN